MSSSTNSTSEGLATFTIKVSGNVIPAILNIFSIHVEKKVNRISTAKIVIFDGDASTGTFDVSSSSVFVPGNQISIEAGYDGNNNTIFQGIITQQSLRIDGIIGSTLEVECRDEAIKMTAGRKSLSFSQKTDSEVISSIIGNYGTLKADVSATNYIWPEQVQFYVSDWDFILSLADMNGLIVTTLNGTVTVKSPGANPDPVLHISYGDNLLSFRADMNALTQLDSVKTSTWDYKQQALSDVVVPNSYPGPGNIPSGTLARAVGIPAYGLQTTAPLENAELNNWANAQLLKSNYAKIQGEAKFQGNSMVDPGKFITFTGLGDRFNGDHLVSGVVHDLSDGNWFTEVSIGLSAEWITEEPDVMAPSASGMLPGARGLFNGTVKKIYGDPDSQYRILVEVPMFNQNGAGIWARLANFYSTSGAGAFFLPEVGDEVVLGFLNEDPRSPVILGSMYSSPKIQPSERLVPNEKNALKAIVSKSKISIEFDDENKVLTIATPGNNKVVLSDMEKKISLQDENSNSITMSPDGITIKSAKNINLEAGENVSVSGVQGVKVNASGGDLAMSGINIKQQANMQFSAKGAQMAAVEGGMELTLKGAMVMIN